MRSEYAKINNYNNIGELGISQKAFETIATKACNSVLGASVKKPSARFFNLDKPVNASIRKNGRVDVHLEVVIKPNVDVQKACLEIQKEVTNEIQMMCETIPFDVSIRVVAVK